MKINKEIKIALMAIVALVVLFFGLNFLKGLEVFSTDTKYFMAFKNISGLGTSTPIYANGYRVGVVKVVDYDYTNERDIMVEVGVDPKLRIPQGTTAEISSDLLGNLQVNLLLGENTKEIIEPGGIIKGDINEGAMGKLKAMIPTIEKMMPKLDSIMTSLNTLMADPAIAQSLHNVEGITASLTTTTRELNTLMGQLNRRVPGIMNKANGLLDNSANAVTALNGQLAKVDVEATMTRVNATLDEVQQLTNRMQSNEGSLGLLMNDDHLYRSLNTTVLSADSLLINFRQHPKRYVHFSIFGKKDK